MSCRASAASAELSVPGRREDTELHGDPQCVWQAAHVMHKPQSRLSQTAAQQAGKARATACQHAFSAAHEAASHADHKLSRSSSLAQHKPHEPAAVTLGVTQERSPVSQTVQAQGSCLSAPRQHGRALTSSCAAVSAADPAPSTASCPTQRSASASSAASLAAAALWEQSALSGMCSTSYRGIP